MDWNVYVKLDDGTLYMQGVVLASSAVEAVRVCREDMSADDPGRNRLVAKQAP